MLTHLLLCKMPSQRGDIFPSLFQRSDLHRPRGQIGVEALVEATLSNTTLEVFAAKKRTRARRSADCPARLIRRTSPLVRTCSRCDCRGRGRCSTSSRNRQPPWASCKAPSRCESPPAKTPPECPNNLERAMVRWRSGVISAGREEHSSGTNAACRRALPLWIARATSSRPVPLSPLIRT